jgi:hypothetical protein
MRNTVIISLLLLFFLSACKEQEEPVTNSSVLVSFDSLTIQNDTIPTGSTTTVTAIAQGTELTYLWSATRGDIVGSGNVVTYVAPTCVIGDNEISCVVKAANKSEGKTLVVTVY